jgi:hypothetical protein
VVMGWRVVIVMVGVMGGIGKRVKVVVCAAV